MVRTDVGRFCVVNTVSAVIAVSLTLNWYERGDAFAGNAHPHFHVVLLIALAWAGASLLVMPQPLSLNVVRGLAAFTKVHLVALISGWGLLFALGLTWLEPRVLGLAAMVAWILSVGSFYLRSVVLRSSRQEGHLRRMVLVGSGPALRALADRVQRSPSPGVTVVGALGDSSAQEMPIPYLGGLEQLVEVLRTHVVDEVAVELEEGEAAIEHVITASRAFGKEAHLLVDSKASQVRGVSLDDVHGIASVSLSFSPSSPLNLFLKRLIDVVGSALGILLLSPLMAVIYAVIAVADRGASPIFQQTRVGRNGRLFSCLKFRTMVANAEALKPHLEQLNEMSGPVFKIRNDPRVTPVGRFLRKTSLDELPQLFNVLVGDMSLVGPRPPLPKEVSQYRPEYCRRLSVPPGITGLWQVSGRNNVDFERWMALDLEYIDHFSLLLDLYILLRTIPAVLSRQGAS